MKHTELPWRVSSAAPTKTWGLHILAGHARFVAHVPIHPIYMDKERETDTANAAYIVQACNAFPELVEALESLYALHTGEHGPDDYQAAKSKALDKAEAALKKAGD